MEICSQTIQLLRKFIVVQGIAMIMMISFHVWICLYLHALHAYLFMTRPLCLISMSYIIYISSQHIKDFSLKWGGGEDKTRKVYAFMSEVAMEFYTLENNDDDKNDNHVLLCLVMSWSSMRYVFVLVYLYHTSSHFFFLVKREGADRETHNNININK